MLGFLLVGSRFAVGAIPILPANAVAKSLKISACKFVVTTISMLNGYSTIRVVIAPTGIFSTITSKYSPLSHSPRSPT
jgi:hypothetical protein